MKVLNIIKYVFTIVGTAMLIGSFYIYKNTNEFIKKSIETEGTVIELLESHSSSSTMYKPLVKFTDNKGTPIEFSSSTSSNPPSYSINEKVKVIYNPEAPNTAKIKSFYSLWGGVTVLGIFGSVFFIIGGSIIVFSIKKKNMLKYLKQHGIKIVSDFKHVSINTSLDVNGKNPFIVVSQWQNPKTSELHIFTSDHIWFDPTDYIKTDEINVLIHPKNPNRYSVDLSFLPKVAE